jgi:two-component system, NarL family, sensor kinase
MNKPSLRLNQTQEPAFKYIRRKQPEDTLRETVNRYRQLIEKVEKENNSLNQKIFKMLEEERHKISKDLHDGIGQTILAAKLNINIYKSDPKRHIDRLDKAMQYIDNISQEIREICTNIYPDILKEIGLEAAIRTNVQNILEVCGFRTKIKINLHMNPPYNIVINIYRIIQEIISNTIKHSKADTFILDLHYKNGSITMICGDNGIGFIKNKINKENPGFGLSNIQHRVESLGGVFAIESMPGKGTQIKISIKDNSKDNFYE